MEKKSYQMMVFAIAFSLIATFNAKAQWTTNGSNVYLTDSTKKISIGTQGNDYLTQFATLNVKSKNSNNAIFRTLNYNSCLTISSFKPQIYYNLYYDNTVPFMTSVTNKSCWIQGSDEDWENFSLTHFGRATAPNQHINWNDFYSSMVFKPTGLGKETNCGIGTNNPQYRLDVCGSIRSSEVRVQAKWWDDVFKSEYNLRPLEEVKAFIAANKHLPDVTPGPVIETEGLEVGKASSQMIRKIEELTLYVIQLNEDIKNLKLKQK